MNLIKLVFSWVGGHATKLAATLRAFFYMGTLLLWWHLTAEQLIGVMAFAEAFLYMFVETNTVSKVRVGERIEEKVAQQVTAITGTGDGTPAGAVLTTNKEKPL